MPRQISGRPDGKNPLIYTGSVPNLVIMDRRPTVKDYEGFELGYWWIVPESSDGSRPTEEVWVLISKRNNIAKWKRLHGGHGPTPPTQTRVVNNIYIDTTGAGTYTPSEGVLQVLVEVIGGGGGSGMGGFGSQAGGGGGYGSGGGYARKMYTIEEIGTSQPYFVGAGGTRGTCVLPGDGSVNCTNGTNGENTTFGAGGTLITGGGGYINTNPATQGIAGGVGSGGDFNMNGSSVMPAYSTGAVETDLTNFMSGRSFYTSVKYQNDPAGSDGYFPGGGAAIVPIGGIVGTFHGATGGNGAIFITEYFG